MEGELEALRETGKFGGSLRLLLLLFLHLLYYLLPRPLFCTSSVFSFLVSFPSFIPPFLTPFLFFSFPSQKYIDLLSFHLISSQVALDKVLPQTGVGGNYAFVEKLVGEGLVRHVGFSTHGDPKIIRKAIDTKKFSYVNIHHHFFGDYHAAGLDDGFGNLGNAGNVKRAKELDMGVFGISPFDKGGALYRPTKIVADLCGPELPPMAFAANHLWQNNVDTVSVGIAKLSDFDEALDAAKRFEEEGIKEKVEACEVSSRTFTGSQVLSFHILFIYL
jgi:predicted aldo/keto reductase-like oxidoreductase